MHACNINIEAHGEDGVILDLSLTNLWVNPERSHTPTSKRVAQNKVQTTNSRQFKSCSVEEKQTHD